MSDQPAHHEHESTTAQVPAAGNAGGTPPRAPRWVKISAIIAAALVLAIVVMLVIGGDHGPDRHGPDRQEPGSPQEQEIGPENDAKHDPSEWSH
jgi:hypothetical protein